MMSGILNKMLAVTLAFGVVTAAEVSAGNPGQGNHKPAKKIGFFQKIGRTFVKIGDKIKNKIMDTHVVVKKKVTGCKNRVWVCGHYNKNGNHVKGHWRYIKNGCGNHPGQGNNPGQGNTPGQGNPGQGNPAPLPPAEQPPAEQPPAEQPPAEQPPAEQPPAEQPPAEQPPAEQPPAEQPPAEQPPAEQPPAEQPPAEQPPADQGSPKPGQDNGQSGQSSGQKRTIGMLMNDLVSLSDDADAVKAQAVSAKKSKKNEAVEIEADYQLLAGDREADSKLLIKVVTGDLARNDGQSGIYYSAFLRNLNSYSKADRADIKDVIAAVKANIKHQAAHGGRNNAFKTRLEEMNKF
ncbi:MAG TPA: hypothetical protein PKM25_01330 [Candidatus Ozemobacteraceae bacterium]|nr:hypothetical protein [Candidatus Ozemobacteraceae bacterium]